MWAIQQKLATGNANPSRLGARTWTKSDEGFLTLTAVSEVWSKGIHKRIKTLCAAVI